MPISRRKFVQTSALVVAAFAATPLKNVAFGQNSEPQDKQFRGLKEIPYETRLDRAFQFKKSSFDPYLNTKFTVYAGEKTVTLTLVEVTASRHALKVSPEAGEDAFSLLFSAGRRSAIEQGTYRIEHDGLGELTLLLVPVNRLDGKRFFAEAVINHQIP
ncbi:MAG TPA: twin-arginine translocation signal domain-containing protein [Pyrinomonadaceae bacterium]|jgi:hypothetical protein|nr:twin-arginine translocation signal domain-containing protein [Pyrinomonadaceae bacterium]